MKRPIMISIVLALLLTACSTSNGTPEGPSNGASLPPMTRLIIGTLKLDGTTNEITKDQAAELVTLWQVYGQLISSDTAAQPEIDGLTKQINAAMTADQLKAIEAMKLTPQDMSAFMQAQGTGMASSGSSSRPNSGSGGQSGPGAGGGFPGGGPGGGMPPGGMPDMGGGVQGGPSASQTPSATRQARSGSMDRVPSALLEALIQYLQKKAGA